MRFWRSCFRLRSQSPHAHLTLALQSRATWRLLKLFPQCFGVVRSEDLLTESQWTWLQCQCLLDDGVHACANCQALSVGAFCSTCGTRLEPEPRVCDQCHWTGPETGTYCSHCGTVLRSTVEEAIDMDTFDWQAWARSLQPFLGGLTPQEQQLLAQDGVPDGVPPTA
jgi:hypothetical protein